MPKDIVEAYSLAVKARENTTRKAFMDVINFCENNMECLTDNSLKRNTLLFWAYDKLADSYARGKDFAKAFELWNRAKEIPASYHAKLSLGMNMLQAANNAEDNIFGKANKVAHAANFLKKTYESVGNYVDAERMEHLQASAVAVLKQSPTIN